MNELQVFLKKVASIIREDIRNGTPQQSRRKIEQLRRKMNLSKDAEKLAKQIAKEEIKKLGKKYIEEKFSAVTQEAAKQIIEAESALNSRIIKLAKQASSDIDEDKFLRNLQRFERVQKRYLETVANTAGAAVRRSQLFLDAENAGVKKYKYAGSTGGNIRPFCAAHVNKIYTLDEIQKMDNGQGLSVQFYCGGYNCRHRWIPLID